jgi:hypothetical protein
MIQFKQGETVWIGRVEYRVALTYTKNIVSVVLSNNDGQISLSESEAQAFLRHAPYDVPDEKPKAKFADAKAGDVVFSSANGKGSIICIHEDTQYPIECSFNDGTECRFTLTGFWQNEDALPSLFHSEQDCIDYWKSREGK